MTTYYFIVVVFARKTIKVLYNTVFCITQGSIWNFENLVLRSNACGVTRDGTGLAGLKLIPDRTITGTGSISGCSPLF